MSEEIARCGCGGEAQTGKSYSGFYSVECINCGMQSGYYDTEADAITAWNKAMGERTAKVESLVLASYPSQMVWKCGECGKFLLAKVNYCPICGARLTWE